MEVTQSCGKRSQPNIEACPPFIQVYSVHSHIWDVQAVRESRVLGAQRGREAGDG